MDPLLISAASGMKARMESLDMLANNVANSSTAGFKADREFYGLWASDLPVIEKHWTDFSQGVITPTGNPLDLALSGKGLFAVNTSGGILYTRNGDFRISKKGELETPEGYTLRNVLDGGRPIRVDAGLPLEISKDGVVRQQGQEAGQIEVIELDKGGAVSKQGNSYFQWNDPRLAPARATDVEVRQGHIEQSNVPVAEAAVRLVSVLRQFEMLQRAMTLGNEMNKRAIEEVARVNP